MAAIDGTIVMLALLPIAEDLHTDYVTMVWVIVAYLLINNFTCIELGTSCRYLRPEEGGIILLIHECLGRY
jgi:hypothetical protein